MFHFLERIKFTWRLIGLTALPFLAFVFISIWGVILQKYEEKSIAELMVTNLQLVRNTSGLVNSLQKERGLSAIFLNKGVEKSSVDTQRQQSDAATAPFKSALAQAKIKDESKQKALDGLQPLAELRGDVDTGRIAAKECIQRYSQLIGKVLDLGKAVANAPSTKGVGKAFITINLLEAAKESAGKLRATMSSLLSANKPLSFENLQAIVSLKANVDANLNSPAQVLSRQSSEQLDQFKKSDEWKEIDRVFGVMVQKSAEGNFEVDGAGFFKTITVQIENIGSLVNNEINIAVKRTEEVRAEAVAGLMVAGAIICVISVLLIFLGVGVIRSIAGPLKRVSMGLNRSAAEVSTASREIASASHSLAEGASEQAATIEETSSSLEEMSSTIKSNSDNATSADRFMTEARDYVTNARRSMDKLSTAMAEISSASDETQKIVKTIDEIAFQTNLLALNAAVEAARAGEAGAGFAVVAEEVRSLALRAADAARQTGTLIEGTVSKVKDGYALMAVTDQAFNKVADSSNRAAELLANIATASREQATGIEQLNTAVSEMDKVTQQNAASSEELASSSEQLADQARHLKVMVDELLRLMDTDAETEPETE